jgi:hypothetical protein
MAASTGWGAGTEYVACAASACPPGVISAARRRAPRGDSDGTLDPVGPRLRCHRQHPGNVASRSAQHAAACTAMERSDWAPNRVSVPKSARKDRNLRRFTCSAIAPQTGVSAGFRRCSRDSAPRLKSWCPRFESGSRHLGNRQLGTRFRVVEVGSERAWCCRLRWASTQSSTQSACLADVRGACAA